jgi:hypothetical protein
VALSGDGQLIASSGQEPVVRLWDASVWSTSAGRQTASNCGHAYASARRGVEKTSIATARERYWVERRWGPYLRVRWREGARKRMKYIGKLPSP